jgi:hypothetical protein
MILTPVLGSLEREQDRAQLSRLSAVELDF